MSKKENLLQEIDLIDQQIAGLRVYLYDVELYPKQTRPWPRFKRSIYLFLTRRQVMRVIEQLRLRRRGVRNCYVYLFKEEPLSKPLEEHREPAESL